MKKISFLILLFISNFSLYAQNNLFKDLKGTQTISTDSIDAAFADTPSWTFPGAIGLNFSQNAFVNWAEGGQNSIAGNAFLQLNANYKRNKLLWNNNLSAEYGKFYSVANPSYRWRKNTDRLGLTSNFGYQATKHWYYAAMVDFRTQFNKGYDYPNSNTRTYVSDFLAPGYLIASVGMDYVPNKYLFLYLSPTTARFVFVRDTELSTNYGLDEGKKMKFEFGAYACLINNFDIMNNVNLNSKLELFSAYETFGNVVVNWELLLAMKVNKYINASIRTIVRYDDEVKSMRKTDLPGKPTGGPKIQFMDAIAVGFAYNF
jgi:hypothetical protein